MNIKVLFNLILIIKKRRKERQQKIIRRKKILLNSFISTNNEINTLLFKMARDSKLYKKLWTVKELTPPKLPGYFEDVFPLYDDYRFKKKFRISRQTFGYLCDVLGETLYKNDTTYRDAIPVPKRILIAITILKSNCDAGPVADLFKVGKSTVNDIIIEFCDAITSKLFKNTITFPSTESQREDISQCFERKWGFPGIMGALDGSHIPIKKPTVDGEDYFDYKKFYSINLLGLVDSEYCFIYVNIVQPGSCHDAAVFKNSELYNYFSDNPTKCHIIADGAFPLLKWLMKPYNITPLTQQQTNFNQRLSSSRMVVENAFGRLKGRWRILSERIEYNLINSKKIVTACVILHNLCEQHGDVFHEEWLEDISTIGDDSIFPDRGCSIAKTKRDNLAISLL